jgi:hypothetical protein
MSASIFALATLSSARRIVGRASSGQSSATASSWLPARMARWPALPNSSDARKSVQRLRPFGTARVQVGKEIGCRVGGEEKAIAPASINGSLPSSVEHVVAAPREGLGAFAALEVVVSLAAVEIVLAVFAGSRSLRVAVQVVAARRAGNSSSSAPPESVSSPSSPSSASMPSPP